MDKINDAIFLREFFPEKCLKITEIDQQENQVRIHAKSITTQCRCPKCGTLSTIYHGTYTRRVQDLPILGKNVRLEIKAREYRCANDDCDATTIAESFDGFLDPYSRLTKRCADFICMLALETSCEGCSRICDKLGIRISGDSVIRLLIKRYESLGAPVVGEVVGVDDFAYKKRNTYGTIIVDERTHTPVTLLDHREYIYGKYPEVMRIHACIRDFRTIFERKNVPLLYLFIEKYQREQIKALNSFAKGLKRDIDAVENAVAYGYSNGFVEGTNSRLKMIKRTMYGRCGKQLLEAKLRFMKITPNG